MTSGKAAVDLFDNRCHPGGFSYAILKRNSTAVGVGVALPESLGGIPCFLDHIARRRIQIHLHDVTRFDLSPLGKKPLSKYNAIRFDGKFDLILLDAHRFETGNEIVVAWEPERMVLSQLIVALEYTAAQGTVVIRLGNIQRDKTVAILYLLSLLFRQVRVLKPRSSHTSRGSFYAVADGFQTNAGNISEVLRHRWWDSTFGGENKNGINPLEWWTEIFPTEELPELFGKKLIQLAMPVWVIQNEGMKSYFHKYGMKLQES